MNAGVARNVRRPMSDAVAYVLDSDAVIWHLRRRARTTALLRRLAEEGPLAVVSLTVYEVTVGARQEELAATHGLLEPLVVLPVGAAEARLAAALARDRGPGLVECHIAAAALLRDVPLVTYNHRDFRRTGVLLYDTQPW